MADLQAIAETRAWVERAVIGLNLCPFARAAQVRDQVHYVETAATDVESLAVALHEELIGLNEISPELRETTLLIHPHVLGDFLDFNDFLAVADEVLVRSGLEGILQIASFHP